MYVPKHFSETRMDVLQAFIARHSFATLVAMTGEGLTANHLPLTSQLSPQGTGMLRGHIARGNSLWRELGNGAPVLAIFDGAHSYVSPSWYPSKREHGKVVPTWNYATVHVSGNIRFIEDGDWLRQFVTLLTDMNEEGRPDRWQVSDAPSDYIEAMLKAIVGLEIDVTRIVGKFKGSQNRSTEDRAAVAAGLRAEGRSADEIAEIAPSPALSAESKAG